LKALSAIAGLLVEHAADSDDFYKQLYQFYKIHKIGVGVGDV